MINNKAKEILELDFDESKYIVFDDIFDIEDEEENIFLSELIQKYLIKGKKSNLSRSGILKIKSKKEISIEYNLSSIKKDGKIRGFVIAFRDFTEKKQKQEKILYLSYHDQLTTLYNRRYFEEQLILLDSKANLPLGIIMIDVNGLKLTNDAFGHKKGDEVLIKVSNVLKEIIGKTGIVARIGGDEFVILLLKTSREEIEKWVERIYRRIKEEKADNIIISISAGYDIKTKINQDVDDIFNKAEEIMYSKKLTESKSMRNSTIRFILNTLNETSLNEKNHFENVSKIAIKIARALNLDNEIIKEVEIAALMHDMGKIVIDRNILNKEEELKDEEYIQMKKHPEIGYHILKSVDEYSNLAEYALSHHEWWDGNGYPRGLKEDEIPFIARIIAVADAFDLMTQKNYYGEEKSKEEALKEIKKYSNKQFDPQIVSIFENEVYKNI